MRPVDEQWIEILRIQALCARYCLTIDTQDGEGWAGCFTEDGAFEFDGWVIRGRPALREYADAHARVVRGRHLTTDLLYEVDGDVATGRSASVVTLATAAGYKILGSGEYQDRLIKQDGQWRIAYRRLRNDRLVSDPSVAVNVADADVAAVVGHLLAAARRLGTQMSDTQGRQARADVGVRTHALAGWLCRTFPNPIIGRRHAERENLGPPLRKRRCDRRRPYVRRRAHR